MKRLPHFSVFLAAVLLVAESARAGDDDHSTAIVETIDNGRGICRFKWPTRKLIAALPATQTLALREIDIDKIKLPFAEFTQKSADGTAYFLGDLNSEKPSSISKEEALKVSDNFIRKWFPQISGRLKSGGVDPIELETFTDDGKSKFIIPSYSIAYDVLVDSIPVYDNLVLINVVDDKVQSLVIRCHQAAGRAGNKAKVLPAKECFLKGLKEVKTKLRINGKYEIFSSKLMYIDVSRFKGEVKKKDKFVLAWGLVINPNYKGKGWYPRYKSLWIDATTGKYLGHWKLGAGSSKKPAGKK